MNRKIVTICGSMRFFDRMLTVAQDLSREGIIVLMPFVRVPQSEQLTSETKKLLDEMHLDKIDMSDYIVVVTMDYYIGESTENEIYHANCTKKFIEFRNFLGEK